MTPDDARWCKQRQTLLKVFCVLVWNHSFYSAPSGCPTSAHLKLQTVQGLNITFSIYKMVHILYTGTFDVI